MSGSAAADSTIEYSVTLIGSIAVTPTSTATHDRDEHDEVEAGRLAVGATSLPHCQPKYCEIV